MRDNMKAAKLLLRLKQKGSVSMTTPDKNKPCTYCGAGGTYGVKGIMICPKCLLPHAKEIEALMSEPVNR